MSKRLEAQSDDDRSEASSLGRSDASTAPMSEAEKTGLIRDTETILEVAVVNVMRRVGGIAEADLNNIDLDLVPEPLRGMVEIYRILIADRLSEKKS